VELIHRNSCRYNGAESILSATALKIVELCRQCVQENEEQLAEMEHGIKAKQVSD